MGLAFENMVFNNYRDLLLQTHRSLWFVEVNRRITSGEKRSLSGWFGTSRVGCNHTATSAKKWCKKEKLGIPSVSFFRAIEADYLTSTSAMGLCPKPRSLCKAIPLKSKRGEENLAEGEPEVMARPKVAAEGSR